MSTSTFLRSLVASLLAVMVCTPVVAGGTVAQQGEPAAEAAPAAQESEPSRDSPQGGADDDDVGELTPKSAPDLQREAGDGDDDKSVLPTNTNAPDEEDVMAARRAVVQPPVAQPKVEAPSVVRDDESVADEDEPGEIALLDFAVASTGAAIGGVVPIAVLIGLVLTRTGAQASTFVVLLSLIAPAVASLAFLMTTKAKGPALAGEAIAVTVGATVGAVPLGLVLAVATLLGVYFVVFDGSFGGFFFGLFASPFGGTLGLVLGGAAGASAGLYVARLITGSLRE